MIKPGSVAIVKTTEEPTIVLYEAGDDDILGTEMLEARRRNPTTIFSRVFAVRRPVASDREGIRHVVDFFFEEELETPEERRDRRIAETRSAQKQLGLFGGPDDTPGNLEFN